MSYFELRAEVRLPDELKARPMTVSEQIEGFDMFDESQETDLINFEMGLLFHQKGSQTR